MLSYLPQQNVSAVFASHRLPRDEIGVLGAGSDVGRRPAVENGQILGIKEEKACKCYNRCGRQIEDDEKAEALLWREG